MLGDDLDAWLAESSLMKRTFRVCAVIAGLIERRHPGPARRPAARSTISSDLIYDVLRKHDPRHILLEAAWADAATGLLDIARLGDFLRRIKGTNPLQALARCRRWRCRCCWRSARSWSMVAPARTSCARRPTI